MSEPQSSQQFTLLQLLAVLTAVAVALGIATPWLRLIDNQTFWLSVFAWFVVVGLVVMLAILPLRDQSTKAASASEALAHGIGVLGVTFLLLVCVPAILAVFREFDMEMATPSRLVFQAGQVVAQHSVLTLLFVVLLVALDTKVFSFLHHRPESRWLAKAWSAAITVELLGLLLFAVWAVTREFFAIVVNLSKTEYPF
jgi:hypothetical protein